MPAWKNITLSIFDKDLEIVSDLLSSIKRILSITIIDRLPENESQWFDHPDKKLLRQKGTAFVFPSILLHGIQPVTKGVRKCLVAFIEGPAWQ